MNQATETHRFTTSIPDRVLAPRRRWGRRRQVERALWEWLVDTIIRADLRTEKNLSPGFTPVGPKRIEVTIITEAVEHP